MIFNHVRQLIIMVFALTLAISTVLLSSGMLHIPGWGVPGFHLIGLSVTWSQLVVVILVGAIGVAILDLGIRILYTSRTTVPATSPTTVQIDIDIINQLQQESARLQEMVDDLVREQMRYTKAVPPTVSISPVPGVPAKIMINDPLRN